MTSEEASKIMPNDTLDYCYLDAGHSYEEVRKDLKLWFPKIKSGGIICGHDYIQNGVHYDKNDGKLIGEFELMKAVDEFSSEFKLKIHITTNDEYPSWLMTTQQL